MSNSSSSGLGSRSKCSCERMTWHVQQAKVPSQAPNPSKGTSLLTTTSRRDSPTVPWTSKVSSAVLKVTRILSLKVVLEVRNILSRY